MSVSPGVTGVPTWDVPSSSRHVTSTKRRARCLAVVLERPVETAKALDSDFGRSKRCLRNRGARRCRVQQVWVVGVRGVERAWPGASNVRSSVAHVETRLPSFPVTRSASPTTFITLSSRWNRSQEVDRSSHRIVSPPWTPTTTFIAAETVKNSVVKSSACLSIPPTEYEPSSSPRTTFSSTSAITVQLVDRRRGCVFCSLLFCSFQHGVVELPMKEWRASGARVQQQPCRLRACLSEA